MTVPHYTTPFTFLPTIENIHHPTITKVEFLISVRHSYFVGMNFSEDDMNYP